MTGDKFFSGKTILITGASSGIGKALAEALAADTVQLILTGRRKDELSALSTSCNAKGAKCFCFYLDVSNNQSIEEFCNQIKTDFNCIDILINNAGISQRSLAEETQLEVDRKLMEVNFFAPVHLTKLLWPLLLKSKQSQVVLMSSVAGNFGVPMRSAYAASKHALEGYFESWLLENQNQNISFTVIAPGRIQTNISLSALKQDGSSHGVMDQGQANGIPVDVCAAKIIKAIKNKKRKIFIVQNEWVMIWLHKFLPSVFIAVFKKLKLS